jgi:outer membrane protein TolC
MPGPEWVPWVRRAGGLLLAALVFGAPALRGGDKDRDLPMPRQQPPGSAAAPGPEILPPSAVHDLNPAVPVTLPEVLKLASIANLDIAQANLVVERARANVLLAKSYFLPTLNLGSTYTSHTGTIQRTEGNVIEVDRDSLFAGLGSAMTLNISTAIFALPEARLRLEAALFGQVRVTNDTLLRVADAYFAVLRARRQLARIDETIDFLTSERESELRGNSKGLLPLIRAFVKSGAALPSDQARVEAEVVRVMSERSRAAQDVRTAAAELARLLHLNAAVFLLPIEDYRWPLDIPGAPWFAQTLDVLVEQALRSRPELAENGALLQAALARYRQSQFRPYLPSLVANYSYGGFGGGPRVVRRTSSGGIVLGQSGVVADFDARGDLDVGLVWRLSGMGLGNKAEIWDNRVRAEARQVQQLFLQDAVVRDVVQAQEVIRRADERHGVLRSGLFDERNNPTGAVYRSLRLNFLRIKGGQGLPLEVLDSIRRLSDVLSEYANALTDLDQSRFRLLVALGLPPQGLVDPRLLPLPAGCAPPAVANPKPAVAVEKGTPREAVGAGPKEPAGVERKGEPSPVGAPLPSPPPRKDLPDDGLHALPPISKPGG